MASASRSRVEVTTIGPVSGMDLAEAIEAAGYEVGRAPWITHDARAWLAAAVGLAVTLHKGENVIELPPPRTGRIQYSCSMGMYGGQLTVVDGAPASSGGPGNG